MNESSAQTASTLTQPVRIYLDQTFWESYGPTMAGALISIAVALLVAFLTNRHSTKLARIDRATALKKEVYFEFFTLLKLKQDELKERINGLHWFNDGEPYIFDEDEYPGDNRIKREDRLKSWNVACAQFEMLAPPFLLAMAEECVAECRAKKEEAIALENKPQKERIDPDTSKLNSLIDNFSKSIVQDLHGE